MLQLEQHDDLDSARTTVQPSIPSEAAAGRDQAIPDEADQSAAGPPRSRRSLLAAVAGGLAASVAAALGRPAATRAAAGDPLVLGQTNSAGGAATRLNATSSGGAFWMTQYGSGSGVKADSVNGHGGVFSTAHLARFGLDAANTAAEGTGAAVRAAGGSNTGLYATSTNDNRNAVHGLNQSGGAGVYGESASGFGVHGVSTDAVGVFGSTSTGGFGVRGHSTSGTGVLGTSASGYGVYGSSDSSYAGFFANEVLFDEYLDIEEIAAPAAPAANRARLFVRDDGAGKTQLCVIFPGGNTVVLGTSV